MAKPNSIEIPTEDVVWVAGSLYCKTPESLEIALVTLREIGYVIEDLRANGSLVRDGRTMPQGMEQNITVFWHAALKDINRTKCGSCNQYINLGGVETHGHICELCGAVTYLEITEDTVVRFNFISDDRGLFAPNLKMKAKRWDVEDRKSVV